MASPRRYRDTLVGPSVKQMNDVATQIAGLVTELANLGSNSSVAAGIILGAEAGNVMIAARTNDGSTSANLQTLTPFVPPNNGQPGVYVPPTGRPAMTPTWGTVAPFGMSAATLSGLDAKVPAPPAITSQAYADQVLQTECAGSGTVLPASIASACAANGYLPETAAEAGAALFWNDPGGTFQPPGHWLQIADTVAASQNLTLLEHAREDALVGEALTDAGIAVWALKYTYNLWRPVDAIHGNLPRCDWNLSFTTCDPTWSSLISLPPHPDYVAGHPGFSGAAATVLADFFGNDNIAFSSTSNAYCNSGAAVTDANGNTTACVLGAITYTSCNNAPVEYGGFTVTDPQYNASPLICQVTEVLVASRRHRPAIWALNSVAWPAAFTHRLRWRMRQLSAMQSVPHWCRSRRFCRCWVRDCWPWAWCRAGGKGWVVHCAFPAAPPWSLRRSIRRNRRVCSRSSRPAVAQEMSPPDQAGAGWALSR